MSCLLLPWMREEKVLLSLLLLTVHQSFVSALPLLADLCLQIVEVEEQQLGQKSNLKRRRVETDLELLSEGTGLAHEVAVEQLGPLEL